MVELAFNYIFQKYSIELDLRYTVPKLNYKGATVQFQRVRAKKAPKIQEVELTQEQREELEKRNLEEQKMKEALAEKKPAWTLYYDLAGTDAIMTQEYWTKLVDSEFEKKVGGEEDRWNELRDGFKLEQTLDVFEEFDGLNHSEAKHMVLIVKLPLLVSRSTIALGCGGYSNTCEYERSNSDSWAIRIATSGRHGALLLSSRYAASQDVVAFFWTYSPRPTSTESWSLAT